MSGYGWLHSHDESDLTIDPNRSSYGDAAQALFTQSTISKDDTRGKDSDQQSLLADIGTKFHSSDFGLNEMPETPYTAGMHDTAEMSDISEVSDTSEVLDTTEYLPDTPAEALYPTSRVDKNAMWRQKLVKERSASAKSGKEAKEVPARAPVADSDCLVSRLPQCSWPDGLAVSEETMPRGKVLNWDETCPQGPQHSTERPKLREDGDANHNRTLDGTAIKGSPQDSHTRPQLNVQVNGITEKPHVIQLATKPIAPASNGHSRPESLGLAVSLSSVAERYLNIDMLDQSQEVSQYLGYLLDTIQKMESKIRFLNTSAFDNSFNPRADEKPLAGEKLDKKPSAPRSQILHRLFCKDNSHGHRGWIYEDEVSYEKGISKGKYGLLGNVEVNSLDQYLNRHPDICFIVFKEHKCEANHGTPHTAPMQQEISERAERLRITSTELRKIIAQVAEFQPYDSGVHYPNEMNAPCSFLFHHRQKLAALAQRDLTSKNLITPLLEFVEGDYGEEYADAERLTKEGRVTWRHLSKLFKPGAIIVARPRVGSQLQSYVLIEFHVVGGGEGFEFSGWGWEFDGTECYRRSWRDRMLRRDIMDFVEEEIPVANLPVHPLEFARSEDIQKLTVSGDKFWGMRTQTLVCYTGWDAQHDYHYTNSRFMVDRATYLVMHKNKGYGYEHNQNHFDQSQSSKFDTWRKRIHRSEQISAQEKMLLPPTTIGFNLQAKKWVRLNVWDIRPMEWNPKAFERLVVDAETKAMIYALVDVQRSREKKMDDIITGKGTGLIILLHGSPGTGKTLTAESVAEIAEKPLYRVTCGDIGTDAEKVEKYLQSVLYLGKIWDCVLLMDEADVFLEERSMADLQRNSLVSIFLRVLEYHEGILILTSNRVGTFDEAFKSRIQVAIHYDNLTKKSRKAIWQNFFDMIEEADEAANMSELRRGLDKLAAEEMNGRQIRNALLTARQLAKHKNEKLDWDHLSQVMKISAAFNQYLKTVRGHTDEQWAREEMLR